MERVFGCDPAKRQFLLTKRGFDLRDVAQIFKDANRLDFVDSRFDYGEERRVTIDRVAYAIFTVVYTMSGPTTWLITAWPANRKERDRYANR